LEVGGTLDGFCKSANSAISVPFVALSSAIDTIRRHDRRLAQDPTEM
jgi:hypothetical protein